MGGVVADITMMTTATNGAAGSVGLIGVQLAGDLIGPGIFCLPLLSVKRHFIR